MVYDWLNTNQSKKFVSAYRLGNRGMVLLKMFEWLVQNNKAEIVALCDLKEEKTKKQQTLFQYFGGGHTIHWKRKYM